MWLMKKSIFESSKKPWFVCIVFFQLNMEMFVFKEEFLVRGNNSKSYLPDIIQSLIALSNKISYPETLKNPIRILDCALYFAWRNGMSMVIWVDAFFLFVCLFVVCVYVFSVWFFFPPQWDLPVIFVSAASVVTAFWWELRKPVFEILRANWYAKFVNLLVICCRDTRNSEENSKSYTQADCNITKNYLCARREAYSFRFQVFIWVVNWPLLESTDPFVFLVAYPNFARKAFSIEKC